MKVKEICWSPVAPEEKVVINNKKDFGFIEGSKILMKGAIIPFIEFYLICVIIILAIQ